MSAATPTTQRYRNWKPAPEQTFIPEGGKP
jgi:hypothetical protein